MSSSDRVSKESVTFIQQQREGFESPFTTTGVFYVCSCDLGVTATPRRSHCILTCPERVDMSDIITPFDRGQNRAQVDKVSISKVVQMEGSVFRLKLR